MANSELSGFRGSAAVIVVLLCSRARTIGQSEWEKVEKRPKVKRDLSPSLPLPSLPPTTNSLFYFSYLYFLHVYDQQATPSQAILAGACWKPREAAQTPTSTTSTLFFGHILFRFSHPKTKKLFLVDIRIEPSTVRAGQRQARHLRRSRTQADALGHPLAVSNVLPRRLGRPSVIETQTIPLVLRIPITFPTKPQLVQQLRFHLQPRSPTP